MVLREFAVWLEIYCSRARGFGQAKGWFLGWVPDSLSEREGVGNEAILCVVRRMIPDFLLSLSFSFAYASSARLAVCSGVYAAANGVSVVSTAIARR